MNATKSVKFGKFSAKGYQFFIGSRFHKVTLIHYDDAVGVANGGKSVRYNKGGATAFDHLFDGALYVIFGYVIECRGRLIQNENARVANQSTRNGNTLLLSARKLVAALSVSGVPLYADES